MRLLEKPYNHHYTVWPGSGECLLRSKSSPTLHLESYYLRKFNHDGYIPYNMYCIHIFRKRPL